MNAKFLIAAALVFAPAAAVTSAALAAPAPLTRAAVTAELYRARAAGEICNNDAECDRAPLNFAAGAAAPLSSSTVIVSGARACQNEAECDAAPRRDFTVTRAQVQAELYRARAAGEIPVTEADTDIGNALQRQIH